jgi:hypothetical protein
LAVQRNANEKSTFTTDDGGLTIAAVQDETGSGNEGYVVVHLDSGATPFFRVRNGSSVSLFEVNNFGTDVLINPSAGAAENTSVLIQSGRAELGYDGTGDAAYFGAGDALRAIQLRAGDTPRLHITPGGSVGINETNPTTTFSVGGSANITTNAYVGGDLDVVGTGGGVNSLQVSGQSRFYQSGAGDVTISHSGLVTTIATAGSVNLSLGAGGATNKHLNIRGNGDVGIGTQSPTQKLDVNGSANITGELFIYNGSSASNRVGILLNDGAGRTAFLRGVTPTQSAGVGTQSNHVFRLYTNNITRAEIDTNGLLAIGTTTHTQSLDVVGSANVTETVFAKNITVTDTINVLNPAANCPNGTFQIGDNGTYARYCAGYTAGNSSFNQSLTDQLYATVLSVTNLQTNASNLVANDTAQLSLIQALQGNQTMLNTSVGNLNTAVAALQSANQTTNASLTTLIGRVNSMNITCTGGNSTHFNVTNGTGCVMVSNNPGGGSGVSSDPSYGGGWTNVTSGEVRLTNNATNVSIGNKQFEDPWDGGNEYNSSLFFVDNTNGLITVFLNETPDLSGYSAGVAQLMYVYGTTYSTLLKTRGLYLDGSFFDEEQLSVNNSIDVNPDGIAGLGNLLVRSDGVPRLRVDGQEGDVEINIDSTYDSAHSLTVGGSINVTGDIYANGYLVCQEDGTNCPASGSGGFIGDQGVNRTSNVTFNSVNISSPGDPILLLNGSGYCWRIKMESTQLKIVDCDGSVIGTFNKDSDSATFTNLVGTSSYAGATSLTGTAAAGQTANILTLQNSSRVLVSVNGSGVLNASQGICLGTDACRTTWPTGGAATPGGANRSIQYNDNGVINGSSVYPGGAYITTEGRLNTGNSSTIPATPEYGITMTGKMRGAETVFQTIGPSGIDKVYQPLMGEEFAVWCQPLGTATGTGAPLCVGTALVTTVGTIANPAKTVATVKGSMTWASITGSTTVYQEMKPTSTGLAYVRGNSSLPAEIQNGGFKMMATYSFSSISATNTGAGIGMTGTSSGTAFINTSNWFVSTGSPNSMFVGFNKTEAVLSYFAANASQVPAKLYTCDAVDYNVSNSNNVFRTTIFSRPNGGNVSFYTIRVDNSSVAPCEYVTSGTDNRLPVFSTPMGWRWWQGGVSAPTTASVLWFNKVYVSTDN